MHFPRSLPACDSAIAAIAQGQIRQKAFAQFRPAPKKQRWDQRCCCIRICSGTARLGEPSVSGMAIDCRIHGASVGAAEWPWVIGLPGGRCISLIYRVLLRKMALLCHTVMPVLESMVGNAEQSSKAFYQIKSVEMLGA